MKKITICLFIFGSVFFSGCGAYMAPTFEDPGNTAVPNYQFNYSVQDQKNLKVPLTFLLISPSYSVVYPQLWIQGRDDLQNIVKNFSKAIEGDFNELMVDRGFRLISLLKDQAMATYSQREQSTFALKSRIEIEVNATQNSFTEPKEQLGSGLIGAKNFSYGVATGEFNVKYKIYLEVYEPFTWQLIWVKTIEEQEPKTISYSYNWNYTDSKTMAVKIGTDSRPQSLANVLMEVYQNTLSKCEVFIDPDEFTILARNADDIRKKAQGVVK
ncbi:MAG: hypothetical protein HYS25_04230 [Ignavibacteriales bacterium]|nr:hypothetical protein [Ignavibacteriales bacterium]